MTVGHSIIGNKEGRPAADFYPTPRYATESLLQREKFTGDILEPACGDGAISKVLDEYGYQVTSRDLYDRGYGDTGIDFLFMPENESFDNVITNPPYCLASEFLETALCVSRKKVAMLLKIQFLEGVKRNHLFKNAPFKSVMVFKKRLTMRREGINEGGSGMMTFAWFVWEHGYNGQPTIDWL